jgi:xylulokinase
MQYSNINTEIWKRLYKNGGGMMVFLGLDIGSSGCKCVAFDETGKKLAKQYEEYQTAPGAPRLSPELLKKAVFSVITGCASCISDKNDIKSITVSSFGESFVPISKEGKPLTDIIMYFADKARFELDCLVSRVDSDEIMSVTRVMPDTMYALPKMMWTEKNAKEPVWKYLSIAYYIIYELTGEAVTDYTLATRTLLFDLERLKWSDKLLGASGIRIEQMPQLAESGAVVEKLLSHIADKLNLPPDVKVIAGAQDQVVNALGAGVLAGGECVDGMGTVECITPLFGKLPDLDFTRSNYVCVPYLTGYLTYAFIFSGGSLIKWYKDTIAGALKAKAVRKKCSVYDLLNEGCPKSPSGMFVIPHFQGAGGTPDVNKNARGLVYGLTLDAGIFDIYKAFLEGINYEMAYNLEMLNSFGVSPKHIFASGGGAQSQEWLQTKADIFDREIKPVAEEECGALGSVMLAATALGCCKNEKEAVELFVKYKPSIFPNEQFTAIYREQYKKYKKLREFELCQL